MAIDLAAMAEAMMVADPSTPYVVENQMTRDPLEDEIEWREWEDTPGDRILEGGLGEFSKRFYFKNCPSTTKQQAQRALAFGLLKAVYEGREREKRRADAVYA